MWSDRLWISLERRYSSVDSLIIDSLGVDDIEVRPESLAQAEWSFMLGTEFHLSQEDPYLHRERVIIDHDSDGVPTQPIMATLTLFRHAFHKRKPLQERTKSCLRGHDGAAEL